MECAPAFNYARSPHITEIIADHSIPHPGDPSSPSVNPQLKALFRSPVADLELDLRYVVESSLDNVPNPEVTLDLLDLMNKGHLGPSVCSEFEMVEGQSVTFVLRTPPKHTYPGAAHPSKEKANELGVSFESKRRVLESLFRFNCNISCRTRVDGLEPKGTRGPDVDQGRC